jgi:hypothetical protein
LRRTIHPTDIHWPEWQATMNLAAVEIKALVPAPNLGVSMPF